MSSKANAQARSILLSPRGHESTASLKILGILKDLRTEIDTLPAEPGRVNIGNLQAGAAARLREAVLGFAGDIRHDLPALLAAIESLKDLSGSSLAPESVVLLRDELIHAKTEALRILEFAESHSLHQQSRSADRGATIAIFRTGTEYPEAAHDPITEKIPPVPARAGRQSANVPDKRPEVTNDDEEVSRLWNRGIGHRQAGELAEALECYTRVIQLSPQFTAAYLKRGQTYHLSGKFDRAIEDYTAALHLGGPEIEAFLRRGDAFFRVGSLDRALADYEKAIQLDPSFLPARNNRAAAYHLAGDFERAITEHTQILQIDPAWPHAFYNRGMAHFAVGDFSKAIEDFGRAIELNPEDAQSQEKLQKARLRQNAQPRESAAPNTTSNPEPAPAAILLVRKVPAPEIKGPETPNQIKFTCPECGAAWSVPWDRLGHMITCKKCSRHYGVKPDGQLTPVTKTADGKWTETRRPASLRERLLHSPWPKMAGALLIVVVGFTWGGWRSFRPPDGPALVELPHELEPRAEALGKAWLNKDLPLLRRLTLSTHERGVYHWFLRHPPPLARKPEAADFSQIRVEFSVIRRVGNVANVMIRIHDFPAAKQKTIDLLQTWEDRDGVWLFIPPNPKG